MPKDHYFKSIDGLNLYYREYGSRLSSGPTLVCLPGMSRSGLDFEDLALYLEGRDFRVICPDYRGRGNSQYDKNWRNYVMTTYIADLQNLMVRAQVYRFALIGGSLGGMLAMVIGAGAPAVVTSIVLNDVGPDMDPDGYEELVKYLGGQTGHANEAAAIAWLKEVQPHLQIHDEEGWRRHANRMYRKDEEGRLNLNWDKNIVKAMEKTPEGADLWPMFRKLKLIPILLLRGEVSNVLSKETAEKMEQELPKLRHLMVPKAGHLPLLTEPGIPEAIADFIIEHARPRFPFGSGPKHSK